jgi:tol-pal system-associated acyl-CoA thioesterase
MAAPHLHSVRIYYEDTDFSGAVYHANYLRYMERAREHLIGPDELVRLYEEDGIGFVVYKAELTFREPARFGDVIEVRTSVERDGPWRAVFMQNVHRGDTLLVEGSVQLVCVDRTNKLVRLPVNVCEGIDAYKA